MLVGALTSCSQETEEVLAVYPVGVMTLAAETTDHTLFYVGTVIADDLINYSFKSGGTIEDVRISKGEQVVAGMILATLDDSDMQLAVAGAKSQMEAAKAQYDKAIAGASDEDRRNAALNLQKAEDAYEYTAENLKRIEQLYQAGGLSRSEYEGVTLELNIREAELEQARELYNQVTKGTRQEDIDSARANFEQARTNYQYQLKKLNETILTASIDGYVAEILCDAGEIIGAGYPVVVVRSENQVVNVGLSQQDVNQVAIDQQAKITINDTTVAGIVSMISETPNIDTRTYDAEIVLLEGKFRLGMIAEVEIITGESSGIWIPIEDIMFAGEDFVYTVENNIVVRHPITLLETKGSKVLVEGLAEGDQLIISNAAQVKPGDTVRVIGE